MLNKISSKIVKILIEKKVIEESNKAIYFYGTMLFLSTLGGLLSIFAISLFFFDLTTVLVFFMFFIPLRVHAGGYHCKNFFSCFVVSNLLFIIVVSLAKMFLNYAIIGIYGAILLSVLTLLSVVAFAPVTNANNPISPKKKRNNRKKSIFYAALYLIIILIFSEFKYEHLDYYIWVASISELSIVFLMIIEIISERSTKNV